MCVCLHLCIYVYIHVCVYTCIYVYIYAYICISTCKYRYGEKFSVHSILNALRESNFYRNLVKPMIKMNTHSSSSLSNTKNT